MSAQRLLKTREAAQILGISYATLKQWIYKRKLKTVRTTGGHHRIPELESTNISTAPPKPVT